MIKNNNIYNLNLKMIRGLGDYKKDDKKGKKNTESYAGGEKSGLAVESANDID